MFRALLRLLWWLSYRFTPVSGFAVGGLLSLVLPLDDGVVSTPLGNAARFIVLGVMGGFLFAFINDLILDLIVAGFLRAPE